MNTKLLSVLMLSLVIVMSTIAFAVANGDELTNAAKNSKHDAENEVEAFSGIFSDIENLTSSEIKVKLLPNPIFIGDGFVIKSDNSQAAPVRIVITKGRIVVSKDQISELRKQYRYRNTTEYNQALRELLNQSLGVLNARLIIGQGQEQRHFILRLKESTNTTAIFYVIPLPANKGELDKIKADVNSSIGTLNVTRTKISNLEIWKDAQLSITEGIYNGTWSLTAYSFKHKALVAKEIVKNVNEGKKIGWFNKLLNKNKEKANNSDNHSGNKED